MPISHPIIDESILCITEIIEDLQGRSFDRMKIEGFDVDLSMFSNIKPAMQQAPHNGCDLLISNIKLLSHESQDIQAQLKYYKSLMTAGGVFISTIIGPATLSELKFAMMETDHNLLGGIMPHVGTFIDIKSAGMLFKSVFDIVVCDSSIIEIEYASVMDLIRDTRILKRALSPQHSPSSIYLGKNYIKTLESVYNKQCGIVCTYEVITTTCFIK